VSTGCFFWFILLEIIILLLLLNVFDMDLALECISVE
jgi:hypothetical protein